MAKKAYRLIAEDGTEQQLNTFSEALNTKVEGNLFIEPYKKGDKPLVHIDCEEKTLHIRDSLKWELEQIARKLDKIPFKHLVEKILAEFVDKYLKEDLNGK